SAAITASCRSGSPGSRPAPPDPRPAYGPGVFTLKRSTVRIRNSRGSGRVWCSTRCVSNRKERKTEMLDLVEEDWKEEIPVGHWTAETVVHLEDEDGDLAFKVAVGDNLTGTQVWGYRENDAKDLAAALR